MALLGQSIRMQMASLLLKLLTVKIIETKQEETLIVQIEKARSWSSSAVFEYYLVGWDDEAVVTKKTRRRRRNEG